MVHMGKVKAIVFGDKIEEGELVDDKMFVGNKKFIYGDCIMAVEYITIIEDDGVSVDNDPT